MNFLNEILGIQSMDAFYSFEMIYRLQIAFALLSLVINLTLTIYAFTGDTYNPHTAMFRMMLLIDVFIDIGYIIDASSVFIHQYPILRMSDQMKSTLPPEQLSILETVTVNDCNNSRPYIFILMISRQWASTIVLIMGLERFLFVKYPLWFKSIRVRRAPIIVFTLMIAMLSAGIGYTNSSMVAPEERTHFTCELTWAFGEQYGWCQSFLVIVPHIFGCLFHLYAAWFARRDLALLHFGNNRNKLSGERRKIRKAKWILYASLVFTCLPQIAIVAAKLLSPDQLFQVKLLLSQLFMAKFISNFMTYQLMAQRGRGILYVVKEWLKKRRKNRVNPNDSITSISYPIPVR